MITLKKTRNKEKYSNLKTGPIFILNLFLSIALLLNLFDSLNKIG